MLLNVQTTCSLHHPRHSSLSFSSSSLSLSTPLKPPNISFLKPQKPAKTTARAKVITCSISKIDNYGTVDFERRPFVNWRAIYKQISFMDLPESGVKGVLTKCESKRGNITKWELSRIVKELRKYGRYNLALQVYEWMENRVERYRVLSSDAAIQLDLIAKVRGIAFAEEFFENVPDKLKDKRVYGALLNAYASNTLKEKAESLMERMKERGYIAHALPYNVMMTLYMKRKEYEKIDSIISEMREKNIKLDLYSYNIWMTSCGSRGSTERMEEVAEQMKQDPGINPNWTSFSTMATTYIKLDQCDKAEECLRRMESRIVGQNRMPYHYLLTSCGSIGKKEEIYRVWKIYKATFPIIPNLGYHAVIAALLKVDDIEGAEKLYQEWLSSKTSFDIRLGNLLMNWYVRSGQLDKAEYVYEQVVELGEKPNSTTWETLADGHIREKRIPEALDCWKEAFSAERSRSWRPKPSSVISFFKLCDEETDASSKEQLINLLRQSKLLEFEAYAALLGLNNEKSISDDFLVPKGNKDDYEENGSDMFVDQFQDSL